MVMKGIVFEFDKSTDTLLIEADPLLCETDITIGDIRIALKESEHASVALNDSAISALLGEIEKAKSDGNMEPIRQAVSKQATTGVTVHLEKDEMSATISVTLPEDKQLPRFADVVQLLAKHKITRGISKKRIQNLLSKALENEPGEVFEEVVAIGLPPRAGRPSKIVPSVPNALDRILRPQAIEGNDKVDMRNLGDMICVDANQEVARRVAPSDGRKGYTVTNKTLNPMKGEWLPIKLGENTHLSPTDENQILASLSGQPTFNDDTMKVDDTFVSKGVNVSTGNINYKGAVIINGDVTENMQIIATGDITINGFVESAFIKSGGDIIITQGATGKMHEVDCQITAAGSMFLQHGQGLDINVGGDLNIKRQLAYSTVKCKGDITVGDIQNPMGNIFASKINCYKSVRAGTVGAVSGSAIEFDFSEGFNKLNKHLDTVNDLLDSLASVNADHEITLSKLKRHKIPEKLKRKMGTLDNTIDKERGYLNYLRKLQSDLSLAKTQYENDARVIANKEMYPGVSVKLNKQTYSASKETLRSRVVFVDGDWQYQPIIDR